MNAPDGWFSGNDGSLIARLPQMSEAVAISARAPLSARHTLHAAVLIDQMSDPAFTARASFGNPTLATAADLPAFRAALRKCEPTLGPIMDLTACGKDAPRLQVIDEKVASDAFSGLPVADLMVSLYNSGNVPKLLLVSAQGTVFPIQPLLQAAKAWWAAVIRDMMEGAAPA